MEWTRREFITSVSTATLATAFPLGRTLAQAGSATDIEGGLPNQTTVIGWTDKTFDKLLTIWSDGLAKAKNKRGWLWNDFWKAGNTLDAAINYFVVRNPANTRTTAPQLIDQSLRYLLDRRPYGSGPWRDDYGWWGIACTNAYKNAAALGLSSQLKEKCRQTAIGINGWQVLYNSAIDSQSFAPTTEAEKYIGTGYAAWNNGNVREYVNAPNTYTPVPNTVTNVGFWAFSTAIYESVDNNQKYLDSMRNTFDWFWMLADNGMLTNSRSLIFETPNPKVHPAWCRDSDRAWTGDQAAFLCNCLKTLRYEPDASARRTNLNFLIDTLIQGFLADSNTLIGADGVLREFDSDMVVSDDNNSNFNNNYCTGPGVFMRYLGYAYPMLASAQQNTFATLISTSAQSAWNSRDSKYQIRSC